ncbi:MAG: hypothetical protein D6681_09445 [Calditrichaeota bacterium]|nr:MAG: hypothetical protein D6681_09445 [Calditrichota bacterium]
MNYQAVKALSAEELDRRIRENQKIYTEFFEPDFARNFIECVLAPIDECYFRSRFIGFDELPERNDPQRPLIYISNHSGMAFPWDAMIFASMLFRRTGYDMRRAVRPLAAPDLSKVTLMNPYLVENFWKRCGGIDATFLNFETMMHQQEANLLLYPEGIPGIGKGFNHRYRLQRFASSFVRLSIKYRTDVITFYTVNGEYINPYNLESRLVNRIVQKAGIPFIPIGVMTLMIPFQPWIFYFGFPARLTYVMGERLKPYEMIDKPYEEITDEEFREIADRIRRRMQKGLDEAVKRYGQKPYDARHMLSTWWKNRRRFPYFIPCFWPSLFKEYERLANEKKVSQWELSLRAGWRALWKNPIAVAFFLPIIGWIPILILGYRQRRR